jgi:hypothetical protein
MEPEVEYRDKFLDLEVDNKECLALEVDVEPFLSILE